MTAPAPYRLVLLGADDGWADDVSTQTRQALARVVGNPAAVAIERELPAADDPARVNPHVLVAFLADAESRAVPELLAAVAEARERTCPVLPLVHAGVNVTDVVPGVIAALNAQVWDDQEARAVGAILRLLGLIERERKLFLSYRRIDTAGLALQLMRALGERSYDVFLDRFSVPPGADFQRRIDIELADKAFVLILESSSAVGSEWVQHEVAYALSHRISLLALTLPDTPAASTFGAVDNCFRYPLAREWLQAESDGGGAPADRTLTEAALDDVLDEVEARYARQLRLRRTELLGSLAEWLELVGAPTAPVDDDWALAAAWPAPKESVFLVTPRAPTPQDLRQLNGLRLRHKKRTGGAMVEGYLVFDAPVQDPDDSALIHWIVQRRPLRLQTHVSMPDLLGVPA